MRWPKSLASELPRAGLQGADRDRPSGAPAACRRAPRRTMPSASSHAGPEQQAVDRLQRLAQRLLEEDVPVQPAGPRRAAVSTERPSGSRPERDRLGLAHDHGGHLRKLGEIVPSAAIGVGMREQPAARSDDVGLGALADLAAGRERRQELEIDLGDGRAGVAAGMRHRDRHERLEPVEIDRRQPDRLGRRFREARIAANSRCRCSTTTSPARQSQLLLAGAIEMNDPVDRRHLLQQQRVVGAPLLHRGRRSRASPS